MPLATGDCAPRLKLKDINGHIFHTDDYRDTVRIFSFADRSSSGRLMDWLTDANIRIKKALPGAKLTYINFADVSIVPRMMRGVVHPVLRTINARSLQQLQRVYDEAGIDAGGRQDIVFHLVPDWSGKYLRQFGIADAANYCLWIDRGGEIAAALHEPADKIAEQFVDRISSVIAPPAV